MKEKHKAEGGERNDLRHDLREIVEDIGRAVEGSVGVDRPESQPYRMGSRRPAPPPRTKQPGSKH